MTSFRRRFDEDLAKPAAASGLLFAGVSAFAIGKLVRDQQADPEREWTEIQIH